MTSIAIIYDSRTGATEKMAKAVAEGASSVKGVEVELNKVGTRFDICIVDLADAVILGSPTHYGSITSEMRALLESLNDLKTMKKVDFTGKIGGVFGSYGWDGGWVTDKLAAAMKVLGIEVVNQQVSAVDKGGGFGIRVEEEDLKKCRELGKAVAMKASKKA